MCVEGIFTPLNVSKQSVRQKRVNFLLLDREDEEGNKVALITERDAHLMIEDDMRRWTTPNWSRTIQVTRALISHTWSQRISMERPYRNRLRQEIFVSFANTKFPTLM